MAVPYGSQTASDYVVTFAKIVKSSVSASTGVVLHNVEGIGDLLETDQSDELEGESDSDREIYGALGVVARPLPPATVKNQDVHADVLCVRTSDGLIPFAVRDVRLRMVGTAPNEGTVALVGYGGGFYALDAVDEGDGGNIHVLYCPYDFTDPTDKSTAQKAHSITLSPTTGEEQIAIVHAEGQAIILTPDGIVLKNKAGDAYIEINDDGVIISGSLKISGGVDLGDLTASTPLAKSAEVIAWAALVNGALNSAGYPVAPLSPTVTTTLTKGF